MHNEWKVRWGLRMTKSIRRCSLTHEGGNEAQSTSPSVQQQFQVERSTGSTTLLGPHGRVPWRSFKGLDRGDPCEMVGH